MAQPAADVLIVGGGLAGSLLALELRERGARVRVVEAAPGPQAATATAWSYGAIPGWPLASTPLARLAAGASRIWRSLQQRHGDLGWRPVRARLVGGAAGPALLARLGVLPLAQVEAPVLLARLPARLAAAGVNLHIGQVQGLGTQPHVEASRRWAVHLADGSALEAGQVVLAAGGGCRSLWPDLAPTLQQSWAGVLELSACELGSGGGLPELQLPGRFSRFGLERRCDALCEPAWVVDAGLVPRSGGVLLGQLSWIAAAGDAVAAAAGPAPAEAEAWLRASFAVADPWLAAALCQGEGSYRQVPVAFCRDGLPLAAPVAGAAGLWVFSGFSGGFAQVPVLAPLLAAALMAERAAPGPATRQLQRLGVWPASSSSSAVG